MHRMRIAAFASVTILALAAPTGLALAHGGATGVVKERMELMSSIAKAMKTVSEMLQGETDYDPEKVRDAANVIAKHGGKQMTGLFPEGSIMGPSEALPEIWLDWERFAALAEDITAYATALGEAADNPRGSSMHGSNGNSPMGLPRTGGPMAGVNSMMGIDRSPMMGTGQSPMNDPVALAKMPPDAAFARVTQTCSACHTSFRKKQ